MKFLFSIILFSLFISNGNSQVVAYDYNLASINQIGYCFDLTLANANIIGHQLNVNLTFHETLDDANNNANPLKQLYTFSGGTERIVFPRVSSMVTTNFAVSELLLIKIPPLAPPGLCGYTICDINSDGFELIDLNNFWCYGFTSFTNLDGFCDSPDSELWTKYFLTEEDALNEVNEISNLLVLNSTIIAYRKTKNTTTGQYILRESMFEFVGCNNPTDDSDNDGIADILEDPNHNYDISDDDTDEDGIPNFQDTDDDGDGILTMDEDYNQNGNPSDDDTDGSGVADYLESFVTLSNAENSLNSVLIFPNPTSDFVVLKFKNPIDASIEISDVSGKLIYDANVNVHSETHQIDLSNFNSGIYFLTIKTVDNYSVKKIIVE